MKPSGSKRRDAITIVMLWTLLLFSTAGSISSASDLALDGLASGPLARTPELAGLPESARGEAVIEEDGPQLRAHLLVSSGPIDRVGVYFELAPGWHLYWRNPGETGIAPELGLEAPGHRLGDIAWPAPTTFREADGLFTTYGYTDRVLLSAPLERLEDEGDGAADDGSIRAEVSALVCRTQCVPASFSLSTPRAPVMRPADRVFIDGLFERSLASVPPRADVAGIEATAQWLERNPATDETGRLELAFRACSPDGKPCAAIAEVAAETTEGLFIPMEEEAFEFAAAELLSQAAAQPSYRIRLDAMRLEAGSERLRGLVRVPDAAGRIRQVAIDLPIAGPAAAAIAPGPGPIQSMGAWVQIFLLALVGGLILNGMPCVMPVLAIKVVAVADMAEKDPREVRLHGIAYTVGILGSMALLAAVVIGLRTAGHSVGWGFQFQEPLFVAAISAVLVAFALNLFGVFEIELGQGRLAQVGQDSIGLRRSLFEGLLAVVLATPCTAPFLGTAVGFAFASSGYGIAAIFLAIGLGLASPFLLVSFFPALARFIPRSGPWMLKLRVGLGFSLLATVLWLLWVLGQTGGLDTVIAMATVLLGIAFLLWCFGQIQPLGRAWLGRASATAIVGFAIVGFNLVDFDRADGAGARTGGEDASAMADGWQTYSEDAVREALASGRPAFVVFTADWCITCQMNEKTVLERDAIRGAFSRADYALFKADWTRRDEAIRQKLAAFGRAGVPLYLVYSPDAPDAPQMLSELLSQQEVLTALASAADPIASGSRVARRD